MKYTGEHENDFTAHGYLAERRQREGGVARAVVRCAEAARKVLGRPKRCRLAHAFMIVGIQL
jgi:hypothetical protein